MVPSGYNRVVRWGQTVEMAIVLIVLPLTAWLASAMYRTKSRTGQLAILPFLALMSAISLWAVYGLLLVLQVHSSTSKNRAELERVSVPAGEIEFFDPRV